MQDLQIGLMINSMNKRWFRILNIIEREQNFTMVDLSFRFNVSQRTIIKDFNLIKEYFGECIELETTNSGSTFKEIERETYIKKKEILLEKEILFDIIRNIFYGNLEDITVLSDRYNYSESTLRKFLLNAKPVLFNYNLDLSLNPVNFIGDEKNVRKFFFDFYYSGEQTGNTIFPPVGDLHRIITNKLSLFMGNYEIGTGISLMAFYYTLYISIVRSKQGKYVTIPDEVKKTIYKERDFKALYTLKEGFEDEYGPCLNKEEFAWIMINIICKRTINRLDQEKNFFDRFNHWPEINDLVHEYLSFHEFESSSKVILRIFLGSFFTAIRMMNDICPILNKQVFEIKDTIKKFQFRRYKENYRFLTTKKEILNISDGLFDDIVASLTIFVETLAYYYQPTKRVLFLLEGDHLIVQAIRLQAMQILGNQYNLTFVALHELDQRRLDSGEFDFVVTNHQSYLLNYTLNMRYVLIDMLPTKKDWGHILNELDSFVSFIVE